MIHKLRRKFILITMSLVTLSLCLFITGMSVYLHRQNRLVTEQALEEALLRTSDDLPPFIFGVSSGPSLNVPVFVVEMQDNQFVLKSVRRDYTVSDEVAAQAVALALEDGDWEGSLPELNLRFLMSRDSHGPRIAFADLSIENNANSQVAQVMAVIGIGGLTAFFFISLYLGRWAMRPVESAWQAQQRFLADASHELKTPLTVILANLSILMANHKPESGPWLKSTQEEALRMKSLVENLLYLAKNDVHKTPPVLSEVNLSDLVWNMVLPFESLAFERGCLIECQIEDALKIQGDTASLKQLVAIFLDNASKYARPQSTITVSLKKEASQILMSFQNLGEPIPAADLPHLFDRFFRSDESRGVQKGYGLGLSIAKTIIDAHHAKVEVTSDDMAGTVFSVKFPTK